jgi:dipeptidyl aminopeptidase/acylaminoacyl peptidase
VRAERFPRLTQVLDLSGAVVQTIADLPLDAQRSTKFDAVRAGRRSISWRSDRPSTLYWFEALDGGDPAVECPERDRLCQWAAPFTQPPQPLWTTQHRLRKVLWGREDVALAWERHYDSRLQRLWRLRPDQLALDPGARGAADRLLERSFEDRYSDPGEPLTTEGPYRRPVLRFSPDGHSLYWRGRGASPQGVHPFLRLWSLDALNAQDAQDAQDALTPHPEMQDLWRCQDPYFESVGSLLKDNTRLLLHRQSETHPPNYWISALDSSQPLQPITDFADPAPQFAGLHREVVTYPRADGVQLSGTLYLPPGYDPERDGPLPTMLWVYPAEFKDRNLAGQVTTAQHAFSRPSMASVLFLLTQGYAVLDNPSLPIVGEGEAEPNDTYVEQLLAGAEAAVEYLVGRGVAARDRLGIGGHSYGAFTTANLLAHSRLFRLGIARSGAYNRTLTPFGFQGEQRHFWDAMETYHHMSPFTHAPKIAAPLLLLHGGSDSNIGTYPIQTERLFEALKGLGATVRYVVLPLEDHGYRSREAVGHALWEMVRWCDRYLKG